ncbi:hypothetical protein FOZ63_032316 [Perkinsus olseni]|uniref:Uncharacterized protein n=1 Tax=Perkinsus olseni TaxID=32597 RepID=A0A7J6SHS0_PEROL|nr:hypothetical protein FOZ63_032316 [Perkinsus olseni]
MEQDEDGRVGELIEQLQSMRGSAVDGGSPDRRLAQEEGDALWHQQASTERMEMLERKGEEEVAATCAALDLLLEKQAELEATMGVSSEEIDAIERLYDMCQQGRALGAEVMAVAKGLRDMRSYEEQAEFYSTVLDDLEVQQREMAAAVESLRQQPPIRTLQK